MIYLISAAIVLIIIIVAWGAYRERKDNYSAIIRPYFEARGYKVKSITNPSITGYEVPFREDIFKPTFLVNSTPIPDEKIVIKKVMVYSNLNVTNSFWIRISFKGEVVEQIETVPNI